MQFNMSTRSMRTVDCLFGNDLDFLGSDGTSDHNNCKEWCNNNDNCEGFAVSEQNSCYFKTYECGNDIERGHAVLHTKIGNQLAF